MSGIAVGRVRFDFERELEAAEVTTRQWLVSVPYSMEDVRTVVGDIALSDSCSRRQNRGAEELYAAARERLSRGRS
jgi:predicted metal-dependent hydrolase